MASIQCISYFPPEFRIQQATLALNIQAGALSHCMYALHSLVHLSLRFQSAGAFALENQYQMP